MGSKWGHIGLCPSGRPLAPGSTLQPLTDGLVMHQLAFLQWLPHGRWGSSSLYALSLWLWSQGERWLCVDQILQFLYILSYKLSKMPRLLRRPHYFSCVLWTVAQIHSRTRKWWEFSHLTSKQTYNELMVWSAPLNRHALSSSSSEECLAFTLGTYLFIHSPSIDGVL